MARYRNRPIRCLLDSSCERSVIGRRYLRGASMKRTRNALSAANKTALPIDGDVDLHFTIEGHAMTANVSVSPAIDELLLGSDWLVENKCRWDFAAGTVYIGDHLVRTHRRDQVDACRRVFVPEVCVVPPRHDTNTPVIMMNDMTIQHRPGRVHSNSDAMSRRPCDLAGDPECRQCKRPPSTSPLQIRMHATVKVTCRLCRAVNRTCRPRRYRRMSRICQASRIRRTTRIRRTNRTRRLRWRRRVKRIRRPDRTCRATRISRINSIRRTSRRRRAVCIRRVS